jgi:DNA-binding beta-propeller fold protein YncE
MRCRATIVVSAIALVLSSPAIAKKKQTLPLGVIAASAGDVVVLAEPSGMWSQSFETGTVGWLYPAPGGVLFAPDLVRGRTTVLDLRGRREIERLEGVTMPHFGSDRDRYLTVADEVMVVSYPERAVIDRIPAGITSPWQVLPLSATSVLVLERRPDRHGGSHLVAVDLVSRGVIYRSPLPGDVRRISASTVLGVLAVADADSRSVLLMDPATNTRVAELPAGASPRDVTFLGDGQALVAALADASGAGSVRVWLLKWVRGELKIKNEQSVALTAAPVRMSAWPVGPRVAVGLESARVEIVDLDALEVVASVSLPAPPRDVVWCDLTAPGPTLPDWSDRKPSELDPGDVRRTE